MICILQVFFRWQCGHSWGHWWCEKRGGGSGDLCRKHNRETVRKLLRPKAEAQGMREEAGTLTFFFLATPQGKYYYFDIERTVISSWKVWSNLSQGSFKEMVSRGWARTHYASKSSHHSWMRSGKKDRYLWVGSNEEGRVAKIFIIQL